MSVIVLKKASVRVEEFPEGGWNGMRAEPCKTAARSHSAAVS